MMDQEIVSYISQAQKHGLTDFEIKQNLLNAGWDAEMVEDSFVFAKAGEHKTTAVENPRAYGTASFRQTVTMQSKPGPSLLPTHPASVTVENQSVEWPGKPFYKKPVFWLAIVLLLVLAGGAYGYYNYVYLTPARIWDNYLTSKKPATAQIQYSFGYSGGSSSTPATLAISGNSGADYTDRSNIKMTGSNTFAITAGALSYNLNFNYTLLSKVLYVDVGDIPALKSFLPDQNIQWVKIDYDELQSYLNQRSPGLTPSTTLSSSLRQQLKDIWSKSPVVETTNYLARENLNGTPVYHLKNQINQPAFTAAVLASFSAIQAAQSTGTPAVTDQDKAQITALLNKFQVKNFDVWIGRRDYQLYKINLSLSAPSTEDISREGSLVLPAQEESRDSKRLGDIRQMEAAIELYHNDLGGYPAAATGTPQNLVPYYIGQLPTAPEPPDGTCSDYYNGYWYKAVGKARTVKQQQVYPSYTLTFCLGQETGGYKAGVGELSPSGITGNIICTGTPEQCISNGQDQEKILTEQIDKMDFAGQITISVTYSDLGKPQSIEAPPNPTDLLDILNGAGAMATSTNAGSQLQ